MVSDLNLFFPLLSDSDNLSDNPNDKLSDDEIRRIVAKPRDSQRAIEQKLRNYKALAAFEKRHRELNGHPTIIKSTSDSMADKVAGIAKGPLTRQTADVLAEHLWWLTQGIEGLPFPAGKTARAGYWNAARKVLAQVGNDAWKEACDICLLILRHPTSDETAWLGRCSSPHGWIGGVVKRVINERMTEERSRQWYVDVSADVDARTLWSEILEYLSGTLLPLNLLQLQDGTATWKDSCLLVTFPLGRRSMVEGGRLEASAERAASRICDASVEVCFE